MAARHATSARDDPSQPPLFSTEEWRRTVVALSLSRRQAEIVGFIVQGKSDKDIERLLPIKHSTIRSHFADIQTRIKVSSRLEIPYRVFETFRRFVER